MAGEIISLGSINADFQVKVKRWPEAGETLIASDFLIAGGGKAANVAFLAQRLGVRCELIGCLD
jgi:ribokinase